MTAAQRTMADELRGIAEQYAAEGKAITAEEVVEIARDAAGFPALNAHLWQVPVSILANEARIQRAHKLLITVQVTEAGQSTRMLLHVPGTPGYQHFRQVARSPDLAVIKLRQLREDIDRSRARLNEFKAILPDDVALDIETQLAQTAAAIERGVAARDGERPAA